jgi:hypothetical protein
VCAGAEFDSSPFRLPPLLFLFFLVSFLCCFDEHLLVLFALLAFPGCRDTPFFFLIYLNDYHDVDDDTRR